jgi:DHA1 family bicyclomycin/chloramphenicol resistance-like MFS transporter
VAVSAPSDKPGAYKVVKAPASLVLLLGALTAVAPFSIDMYLPSLPALAKSFGLAPGAGQITIAAFLAGLAIGQFLYGPASDRWGRRGPILFGAALYFLGSVACALAPSLPMLVLARFIQAVGGAGGMVIARAIVRDQFDHRNAARVLSLLMIVSGLGPVLAPLIGSALVNFVSWRVIFWILAGFGLVLLVWSVIALKETRSAETEARARGEHPLRAYLALLKSRRLIGYTLAMSFNGAAVFAYVSAAPGLLIGYYHIPPSHFGWVFSVNGCALIAMNQVNARLLHRYTPEQILVVARPATLVVAFALAVFAVTGFGGMWAVLACLFLIIGSLGFVGANTTAAGLNVDPTRSGTVSSLMGGANFAISSAVAAVVSSFADIGPRPMGLTIFASIALSAAALYGLAVPRQGKAEL